MISVKKMGTNFPQFAIILTWAFFAHLAYAQIELPQTPSRSLPPAIPRALKEKNFEERKQKIDELIGEKEKRELSEKPTIQAIRREKIIAQTLLPAPMNFGAHLLVAYTKINATQNRDYDADISSGFHGYVRFLAEQPNIDAWAGFRWISFGGQGFQNDQYADFSFNFFGPSIGIGKISPQQLDLGVDAAKSIADGKETLPVRDGWFLFTGIAAINKSARVNQGERESDFDNKAVGFDSPGLWVEAMYARIHYNALSYNFVVGAQAATAKQFYYGGIAVGLWH